MDVKKFGGYLTTIGVVLLLVAGYFWYSVNSSDFRALESEARSCRAYGGSFCKTAYIANEVDRANDRMMLFGGGGALFIFLGFALRKSSKT